MATGLIDSACITSVIDCLHCQKLQSVGRWAGRAAIETTVELINNTAFGLAPSPEKSRVSVGDFSKIQKRLSLQPNQINSTKGAPSEAEKKAKTWFRRTRTKFGQSFREVRETTSYKTWLNLEVDFIWKNHADSQGGLFNNKLIPDLAFLLGKDQLVLEELQQLSKDWQEVQRLSRLRWASEDFVLLSDAYAGAFFLRGAYHQYLAHSNGYSIKPHSLRLLPGFLPKLKKSREDYAPSPTIQLLAYLILECARKQRPANRAAAYAEYVKSAREKYELLDRSEKSTKEGRIDAAARGAVTIGLCTQPALVYGALEAGLDTLAGGITSVYLDPFYGIVVGSATGIVLRQVNLGRRLGKVILDSESNFKAMLAGPPGRLGADWDDILFGD